MDKQAVKVVKGDETVDQLSRNFSRIVWYFLARSGEISVKVMGRCWRMQVLWQFEFNCSNKVKMKLLKERLVSKSWVRTVLKILTYGSFRSHWKQWSTTGFIMCNLYLLKVFSSICDKNKPFSEKNGLVYKPHPWFLTQKLSEKVRLIHESLRYSEICFNRAFIITQSRKNYITNICLPRVASRHLVYRSSR